MTMTKLVAVLTAALLGTLPSTTPRTDLAANGSLMAFDFGFRTPDTNSIKVFVDADGAGTASTFVEQTTGITKTLTPKGPSDTMYPGGTVTFTVAPVSGATVRIERTVPLSQDSLWTPYSAFKAKTMEGVLDKLVTHDQQLDRTTEDLAAKDAALGVKDAALQAEIDAEEATRAGADTSIRSDFAAADGADRSYAAGIVAGEASARGVEDAAIRAEVASAALGGGVSIGDASTVQATGSNTPRQLKDRAADEVWVTDHNAKCDNATDDSAAFVAAIAKAMETGKTLRLPAGRCRIDSIITIANDGATPPKQAPLKIVGAGAHVSGRGTGIMGGTVLDMRGVGAYGKLVTSGLGLLEITGVTFTDTSGGTTPWVYTTNTTLHIHHNAFVGTKAGSACDQDGIVLGGTTNVEGFGGLNDGFQGYATVIRDNFFDRVRRAVYLRVFANAVTIADNTVWTNSGGPTTAGAIEVEGYNGLISEFTSGGVISGNLIEMVGYVYGIRLTRAIRFTLVGNNFYDSGGSTVSMVRYESGAFQNTLIDGYGSNDVTGIPMVSYATPTANPGNTRITSAYQGKNSISNETDIHGPVTVRHAGADIFADDLDGTGDATISIGRAASKKYQFYLNHLDDSLGLRQVSTGSYPWKFVPSSRTLVFRGVDSQFIHPDTASDTTLSVGFSGAKKWALYNDATLNNFGIYDWTAAAMRLRVYAGTGLVEALKGLRVTGDKLYPPKTDLTSQGAGLYYGAAAPTSGTFVIGDRVFNSAPAVGQPKGWICTVSGTPGTWVSEGNL
jgi:hypothetical protein